MAGWGWWAGEDGGDGVAGEGGDAGLGVGDAAQDPLEGGAPAGDHHEVVVGGRRHRRIVTLDDRHLVACPPELERRGQARNTATDHHDLHRRKSRPSKSPQLRHASM